MSLEDLKSKAGGYVLNGSILEAPYINVNVYTVTQEALDSAIEVYFNQADEYASSFTEIISAREYIVDRLQKDLAGECEGLTSGGIDKKNNKITLHIKADDVYNVAKGNNVVIGSIESILSIMNSYGELHSAICMNDEGTEPSLQPIYVESEDDTYDTKSIDIEFADESRTFINDNPGYIGNEKTYTAYDTSIDENTGLYVNTSAYTVGHYENISIDDETTVTGWFIRDGGNVAVAYSEAIEGPYTLIGSPSSSESSDEPSGEPSEEPSEEPSDESSGGPSEEP